MEVVDSGRLRCARGRCIFAIRNFGALAASGRVRAVDAAHEPMARVIRPSASAEFFVNAHGYRLFIARLGGKDYWPEVQVEVQKPRTGLAGEA